MSPAEQWANSHARNIKQERIAIHCFAKYTRQLQHSQKVLENIAGVFEDPMAAYEASDIERLLQKEG